VRVLAVKSTWLCASTQSYHALIQPTEDKTAGGPEVLVVLLLVVTTRTKETTVSFYSMLRRSGSRVIYSRECYTHGVTAGTTQQTTLVTCHMLLISFVSETFQPSKV
jgi:hypothetical protein